MNIYSIFLTPQFANNDICDTNGCLEITNSTSEAKGREYDIFLFLLCISIGNEQEINRLLGTFSKTLTDKIIDIIIPEYNH